MKKADRITKLSRNSQQRNEKERLYIFCEGKQTEPNYLRAFCRHHRIINLIGIEAIGGGNAISLFEAGKFERNLSKLRSNYDEIWYVFDKEMNNSEPTFLKALEYCEKYKIKPAWSNPSIEFWFLLHYGYTDKPFPDAKTAKRELAQKCPGGYTEATDIFPKIHPYTNDAIQNATKRINNCEPDKPPYLESSTLVHLLVQKLLKIAEAE